MSDEFQSSTIDLSGGAVQVIQTSRTNPRVIMDKAGLRAYNAAGAQLFNLDAITGSLTTTAVIIAGPGSSIPATYITGTLPAAQVGAGLTAAQIASVNASALAGTLTSSQIASVAAATVTGTLTSSQIASVAASTVTGTLPASHVGTGLTSSQIASVAASTITGTLTSAQIASVAASAITGTIVGTQIANGAITSSLIAANTIVAANIFAGAITGTQIAANTITAGLLNVSTLSAISANLGTITAGTITSATLQSASADPRVVHDNTGIWVSDNTGAKIITLSAASGLSLPSFASSVTTGQITWISSSIPAVHTQIYGTSSTGGTTLTLITSLAASGAATATLGITTSPSTDSLNYVLARATNAAATVTNDVHVIDGAGASSFMQLASIAKVAITYGATTLTWTASAISTSKTVAHGLPRTPTVVIAAPASLFANITVQTSSYGAANFTLSGAAANGGAITATYSVTWIAIG